MSRYLKQGKSKKPEQNKNLFPVNILLCLLTVSSVLVYLFGTNGLTVDGYRLKNLEEQKQTLETSQKILNLELSRLQSTPEVAKKIEALELEKVSFIEYLTPSASTVAYGQR